MPKALRAIIHEGKIEPLEQVDLPEGSKVLVTLLADDEADFWLQASQASLDTIWGNPEDDVYAQLLKE
jgi:predicted DNA-binding antitoxin AbrB/MazE fold protein